MHASCEPLAPQHQKFAVLAPPDKTQTHTSLSTHDLVQQLCWGLKLPAVRLRGVLWPTVAAIHICISRLVGMGLCCLRLFTMCCAAAILNLGGLFTGSLQRNVRFLLCPSTQA